MLFFFFLGVEKVHVYSTLFPKKGKTYYKIIGYIQNLLIASEKLMTAHRKSKETVNQLVFSSEIFPSLKLFR